MGGAKRFSVSEACERLTFKDVYLDVRRFILMFPQCVGRFDALVDAWSDVSLVHWAF